jgi:hypothetical protein
MSERIEAVSYAATATRNMLGQGDNTSGAPVLGEVMGTKHAADSKIWVLRDAAVMHALGFQIPPFLTSPAIASANRNGEGRPDI